MSSSSVDSSAPAPSGEWLSAREALQRVEQSMPWHSAIETICSRANDELIETRAAKLVLPGERWEGLKRSNFGDSRLKRILTRDESDRSLPSLFWWARGGQALKQNWTTGDFSTFIDHEYEMRAYGVEFYMAGILEILGEDTPPARPGDAPAEEVLPIDQGADAERPQELHHVIQEAIRRIRLAERRRLNDSKLAERLMADTAVKSLKISENTVRQIVGNKYPTLKKYKLRIDKLITADNG